jgi:hypothetical protein
MVAGLRAACMERPADKAAHTPYLGDVYTATTMNRIPYWFLNHSLKDFCDNALARPYQADEHDENMFLFPHDAPPRCAVYHPTQEDDLGKSPLRLGPNNFT